MEPDLCMAGSEQFLDPRFERYLASLPVEQQICLLGEEILLRERIVEFRRALGDSCVDVVRELEILRARLRRASALLR